MSKSTERKVKILDVTPEIAERWLNSNTHNRPIRNTLVDKYALAMKAGEWRLTPEPLAFSKPFTDAAGVFHKETLIEGQHRLWAIVNSKATVPMTVWYNCDPEEFAVMGQGATRTQGDMLALNQPDLKDPTLTSSIISSVMRFAFSYNAAPQAWQTDAVFQAFKPELLAVTEYKKKLRKLATRPVTSSLFMAQMLNPGMTGLMVTGLKEAVGFTDRDPARALHQYLHDQITIGGKKESVDIVHYKTCHAICAKLRGDPLKVLRVTTERLKWLREANEKRIESVVREINGGRLPRYFYEPQMQFLTEEKDPALVDAEKIKAMEARMGGVTV
jgi:hypothetical protein